ncbi:MAG: Rrf2 family transcriptional regulator [Acidobacteria bacterium]|nr:Rrf2 family transcriptional regulator [Acidobacteriota bacterium]
MKISTKGEYGVRAMLYIASHGLEGPVTSREIADHQGVPEPYLRQILALLSKDRLIVSNRGPQGGHALARPAESISLKDILMTLEGHTTSVDQILALPCNIEVGTEHCVIREVLLKVKEAVEQILVETSLADLVRRQEEILERRISIPSDLPGYSPLLPVVDSKP